MKGKLIKIKNFVLRKLLPIICVISFLLSVFVVIPQATVVTENEFLITANAYDDLFVLASMPYANDFVFQTTNNPEWNSPILYSNSFNGALDTLTLQFQYSSDLMSWFYSNVKIGQDVKVTIPFVFYNSSSSTNYFPPYGVYVSIINANGDTSVIGAFEPLKTTTSYVVFNLTFDYENDFNAVMVNSPVLRFDFKFATNGTVSDEALCGLTPYTVGGEYYNQVKFEVDLMPVPPSTWDPNSDNYQGTYGSNVNDYFDIESELNSHIDHTWINSFFANASAMHNFGNGLGAVRSIFNEFFNYNGSQYTWLSNLLNVSLYIGLISFVLGFSVYFMGSLRGKRK